jgi:hypothetical protein
MSGNPNWNPPLQTSSVRFPRKAVENPTIPANSTTRQRYGAPFQPVYPNPITQIPPISVSNSVSATPILESVYVLSNGTGLAYPYNVNKQTIRGVPVPTVVNIQTAERYLAFAVQFNYTMKGTDHFIFAFTNINTGEQNIKNYQPAKEYLVSALLPGVPYTLTVAPNVNGITYPASASIGPFSITAISEKNVQLQGLTLSGGDKSATISFTNAVPGPPLAVPVTTIAIDDNFRDYQLRCNVIPTVSGAVNSGYVNLSNLTNGSSYVFTVTPFTITNGVYEYGRPSTLPPYIPGPPSDLYVNSITASGNNVILNTSYDTFFHPTPVSNSIYVYTSTFTTLCSFVSQTTSVIQDLSVSYAAFTTLSSLFTPSDIDYLTNTVSSVAGSIQVDITNNTGLWYSFPLTSITTGGLGYTFANSNFTKTVNLYSNATTYDILFRSVNLLQNTSSKYVYNPPQTSFTFNGLGAYNYTFVGNNYANGLTSLRPTYSTIAVGNPSNVSNISGIVGNHVVSISFSSYNPFISTPGPKPVSFLYTDNYGNTYTSINSNVVINGLTDGSSYTFGIQAFANSVYSISSKITLTPTVQPPANISVSFISNYNVTVSFTPAIGGADYYVVDNQRGVTVSTSPYIFTNLSANISYYFSATSYAYNNPTYTLNQTASANLIQEISTGYANFLVSPSAFPYASFVQKRISEFVPYNYNITSSGQTSTPIQVINNTFTLVSGNTVLVSNSFPITSTISALATGTAVTATVSSITYTVTSITSITDGMGNTYNSFNGGPLTLSALTGQSFTLSVFPISNTLTFPIASISPVYNSSGNIILYNIQNSNVLKSVVTFSGATVYNTTLSSGISFYSGMLPTTYSGTISSAPSSLTLSPAYVGPPSVVTFNNSSYASGQVTYNVSYSGYVVPSYYSYAQVGGSVKGTSISPNITITGLTNGSAYSFSISAFGNQVFSPFASLTNTFTLSTNSPSNVSVFFNGLLGLTPNISFSQSTPPASNYYMSIYQGSYNPENSVPIQTIVGLNPGLYSFNDIIQIGKYSFTIYGILYGISSLITIINNVINGPPSAPINFTPQLSNNKITFNWSSGNINYNETYKITEYLANNSNVNPTGLVISNISGYTYTISAVTTTSATQVFSNNQFLETSPGYASFILNSNAYPNFTNIINTKYVSNQIYLRIQQSGGLSYTYPLTNVSAYNTNSNIYFNPNYPKNSGDIFNPTYSVSVTYSYGTGPLNYGTYNYAINASANAVYGPSTNTTLQMFVQPVNGVPSVAVSGTTATISFSQPNVASTVYTVTNNYGSNVSSSPYQFTNLSSGYPYYFYVIASNGPFVSISSKVSPTLYVGPPGSPLVSTSYYGQTANVYVTDTTLSLKTVYYDTGKQNTGGTVTSVSHSNAIQNSSGGFWVPLGGNGGIVDSSTGFLSSFIDFGSAVYSNDGNIDAVYQFTVSPSTGSMLVSLSSYLLNISSSNIFVSNGNTQVYSGTTTLSSYPIQIVSRSNAFGIQSGLSSFYYTNVPALTDQLTISLYRPASFYDYKSFALLNVGVPAASYTISDQLGTLYNPSLAYTIYSLSGITYTYNLFNVSINVNLTLGVTPFGNNVYGTQGNVNLYINTEPPGAISTVLTDTTAVVTVLSTPSTAFPVDSYNLITISGGNYYSTLTSNAVLGQTSYVFTIQNLANHGIYQFTTYTMYLGISSQVQNSTPLLEAGHPYNFSNLSASVINPDYNTGNYTLNATLSAGFNTSNTIINISLYRGQVFYASKSLNATSTQNYLFTVSGGFVYTLSSYAIMNNTVVTGPSLNVQANPFPPKSVILNVSSSDQGNTYNGVITYTASPTPQVAYSYLYSSNNGTTIIPLTSNTFSANYNISYIGYIYSSLNTLTSITVSSAICNVFVPSPSNVTTSYNGSNITVNWSTAPGNVVSYYTIKQLSGSSVISSQQNIGYNPPTAQFNGSLGSSYKFFVQSQSGYTNSSSLVYSYSNDASSALVSLVTASASPITIDYTGSSITLNWPFVSSSYVYNVSQILGPGNYVSPNLLNTNSIKIDDVALSNTYRYAVSSLLFGIPGQISFSPSVTLSTGSMINVTQSYYGNIVTISWSSITSNSYVIQETASKVGPFTTTATSYIISGLSYNLSYAFQTYAVYKNVPGPVTTLSTLYLYTNNTPVIPVSSYFGRNINVTWSSAIQPDGNYPNYYVVNDVINNLSQVVTGRSVSAAFTGTLGLSYQFFVNTVYNGIISSTPISANTIQLFTAPPTNVIVTNSGSNLLTTWNASSTSGNTYYSVRQLPGGQNVLRSPSTTSNTNFLTLSSVIPNTRDLYNFGVTAVAFGISSVEVSAPSSTLVYTYPVSNVSANYLGDYLYPNQSIYLTSYWSNSPSQTGVTYSTYLVNQNNVSSPTYDAGTLDVTSSRLSNYNLTPSYTYTPYVYATRNGLKQSVPDVSGRPITVFTAPPAFNGIGFNGTYAIILNVCAGPTAVQAPDTFTLTEVNNLFFPSNSVFTFSADKNVKNPTFYTIPTKATQGLTYNFLLYSTLYGVTSLYSNPPSYTSNVLQLITQPVDSNSLITDYSGQVITFSWSEAYQCNSSNPVLKSPPNQGYTVYVSSLYQPITQLYTSNTIKYSGVAGNSYQFSVEAANNNVGSAIVTSASALVYLYKPTVSNLIVTNSGATDSRGSNYVIMTLDWIPDLNAPGATYTSTLFNYQGVSLSSNTTTVTTTTFNGSLDALYYFNVYSTYKGIKGNSNTASISNVRPILSNVTLTNIGNYLTVQYTANIYSYFTISLTSTNGGTVISNITSNNASSIYQVTSSTGAGFTYSVSTTAFYNGLPSLTCNKTISLTQPNAPTNLTFNYNNALVTSTWVSSTNATYYSFTAYDTTSGVLVYTQPNLVGTSTSFTASLGHTYSISLLAFSSTNIPSTVVGTSGTIVIPPTPTDLVLTNFGQTVTVSWTPNYSVYSGYSFYVSDISQNRTLYYSNLYALPGDTFQGSVFHTYNVSLYGISLCNVTSTNAIGKTINVYQPSIPFVTLTNVGADNTLTFPQDSQQTCLFWVQDNNGLSLLLSPPGGTTQVYNNNQITTYGTYTQSNKYVSYTISKNTASIAGTPYIYTVIPIYNAVQGNAVTTNTQSPLILYKPTQPPSLTAAGTAYNVNVNWQSAVIYTTPEQLIPSYILDVTSTCNSYTPISNQFIVGNSYNLNSYDASAGTLSISVTAVTSQPDPMLPNPIYGTPRNVKFIVPSTNAVSITQDPNSITTLLVNVPTSVTQTPNYTWFAINAIGKTSNITQTISTTYQSTCNVYRLTQPLGFSYTISAYFTTGSGNINDGNVGSTPANPNPYPAVTLPVSSITTTHNSSLVTVNWLSVSYTEYYEVRSTTSTLISNTASNRTTFSNDGNTMPFAANSNYSYNVTAYTLSTNTFTNGTQTIFSKNLASTSVLSPAVTITVPPAITNFSVIQVLSNLSTSWTNYNTYPQTNPNDIGTPFYSVSVYSPNGSLFSNYYGTLNGKVFNNIVPGSTYSLVYSTSYLGITGTVSSNSFTTINPSITSAVITDKNNTHALLSASSPTFGSWKLGTTTISTASVLTNYDLGAFSAGASVQCNVTFVDAASGLSTNLNTNTLTFPSLAFGTISTTDTGGIRTFNLNLNSSITNPVGGQTVNWSVTVPTGATTTCNFPITGTSVSIPYSVTSATWPGYNVAAATFAANSIYYTYDGFTKYYTSSITFVPPDLSITASLTNVGGKLTLNASVPSVTPTSWTSPSTIGGLNRTTSVSNANTLTVTYDTMSPNTTYTLAQGGVGVVYEGYSNSNNSSVSNVPVNFSIQSAIFADNGDGVNAVVTLTYGSYSGATGPPTWTVPSTTSNGGGYYQLSINGPTTSTSSPAYFYYSNVKAGSNYAIPSGTISLTYGGITSNYGSTLTASTVNPVVTNVTTNYYGCIEDSPTNNYIKVNLSGNTAGTWSLDTPSGLNPPTITGQGTANAVATFTGASKFYTSNSTGIFPLASNQTVATFPMSTGNYVMQFTAKYLTNSSGPILDTGIIGVNTSTTPNTYTRYPLIEGGQSGTGSGGYIAISTALEGVYGNLFVGSINNLIPNLPYNFQLVQYSNIISVYVQGPNGFTYFNQSSTPNQTGTRYLKMCDWLSTNGYIPGIFSLQNFKYWVDGTEIIPTNTPLTGGGLGLYNFSNIKLTYGVFSTSIPFVPTSLNKCQLWLDAADPNGNGILPANNSTLSSWVDKSGLGNNGVPIGTGPTFITNVKNGLPGITFPSTSSILLCGNLLTGTNFSMFAVIKYTSGGAEQVALSEWKTPAYSYGSRLTFYRFYSIEATANGTSTGRGFGPYTQADTTAFHIYSASLLSSTNSPNSVLIAGTDGNDITYTSSSGPNIDNAYQPFSVGGDYEHGSGFYPVGGYVCEVIVYNYSLTIQEVNKVEGYLAWKWGLQTSLPTNHPYYTAPPLANSSTSVRLVTPSNYAYPTFNSFVPDANGNPAGININLDTTSSSNGLLCKSSDQNYSNLRSLTSNIGTTNLNANYLYQIFASTVSPTNIWGPPMSVNVIYPGMVNNVTFGSGADNVYNDNNLYNYNSLFIAWTSITGIDNNINSSNFSYTIYSNTNPPQSPSSTAPGGTVIVSGLSSQTNYKLTNLTAGTYTYYVGTIYTDPVFRYSYYSAGSGSQIKFTIGLKDFSETQGINSFNIANTKGILIANVQGAGGGGSYTIESSSYYGGAGGGGGFTGVDTWRGISSDDEVVVFTGKAGGGAGGAEGGGIGGNGGGGNGVSSIPYNSGGGGGGYSSLIVRKKENGFIKFTGIGGGGGGGWAIQYANYPNQVSTNGGNGGTPSERVLAAASGGTGAFYAGKGGGYYLDLGGYSSIASFSASGSAGGSKSSDYASSRAEQAGGVSGWYKVGSIGQYGFGGNTNNTYINNFGTTLRGNGADGYVEAAIYYVTSNA